MKTGTPGFVGARLREAREARGLTAMALAGLLGVTRSAVSYYETGVTSPQPEVMERIALTLNLKTEFFFRPSGEASTDVVFYRSMASATKGGRVRGERRYEWLSEIVAYLRKHVRLPKTNLPTFGIGENWRALSEEDIERIASEVRRFWRIGDGPISNVVLLMENNGTIVTRMELGEAALDAFSVWNSLDDTPYVILGADKASAVRSRYDIAHELGHLVLHKNMDRKCLANTTDFAHLEGQAHRFAGAFLTPAPTFSVDVFIPNLDSFRALKPKWRVSIGMMVHRAQDLNLIGKDQAEKLWISYNRRGWRTQEPMDDTLPVEEPRLLRRAFEVMIEHEHHSRSQLVSDLPFNRVDIEELAGLPYGYLDEDSPYVWAINSLTKR